MSMEKTVVDWETHLDNRIPITRDDTRRRSIARTLHEAAKRAKVDENAVQVNQGHRAGTGMVRGRKAKKGRKEKYISFIQKEKPLNCCSSSAARRVSENADAICEQSNRETSETQEIFL